ncbi:MAG: NADH:ubiquinone reductase (Na(+)-transporting) subunit D [Flavobacteriales bacterium]|nr:NADH:ubiquinone reductase (Na(+)-transporting) subunit D [Flavobacteriales bacterium]
MSTETAAPAKPAEGLFSKKNRKLITDPLNDNNPITVQVLGICSALAITVKLENALVMSASVMAVLIAGNMIISALRNLIPGRIRIIAQLVIAAGLVTLVDIILKAYVYDVSKQVGVYVGLIITNCILMGRYEAFAMGNKVWPSALDGLGNSLGYAWILVAVAFFRELFGNGSLMGMRIIPESFYAVNGGGYFNNNMMILPPMALVIVGIIIWIQRSRNTKLIEQA